MLLCGCYHSVPTFVISTSARVRRRLPENTSQRGVDAVRTVVEAIDVGNAPRLQELSTTPETYPYKLTQSSA